MDQTKTKEYKEWKKKILDGSEPNSPLTREAREATIVIENIGWESVTNTNDQEPAACEADPICEAPAVIENISGESTTTTNEQEPSILEIAAQEILPTNPMSIQEMDEIVDRIIRELEEDDEIRDLVGNINSDDEGIEINIDTELDAVLEPFDYQLEVEGVDW